MVRTQIQLPDELDHQLRQLAKEKEWTLAEALRRGAELLLASYHAGKRGSPHGPLPIVDLGGPPRIPESEWREAANLPEEVL